MASRRYKTIRVSNLIKAYIKKEDSSAKSELSDIALEKGEIIDILDNLSLEIPCTKEEYLALIENYTEKVKEYEKLKEEYKTLDKNHKGLKNRLEALINNSFPEQIKKLIKEY